MEAQSIEVIQDTRKKKWKKRILIAVGILVITLLTVVLFVNGYINRSLAQVDGEIDLAGLQSEVTVITDEQGVPHISATTEHDLYMAQGYVQAQHRIFQMEMSRRQASGTLSEIVGSAAVDNDKYFRTLGLRRAAEKSYELYTDESKAVLQSFADGVNAYIKEATENNGLPIEFTLMGSKPAEWTPLDSLTIGKYMAFDLGGHWESQAFNQYLLETVDEEKAMELFPAYPENRPTIIDTGELDIASSLEKAVIPHAFNGSNNWVVSGDKTASGMPMLADDPHLGLGTPSIWIQMHLEAEEINVSGVIFAGVPGIILGHNEDIAWGVTNTGPDVQQLYVEKRNPENDTAFLYEDKWEEATIIEEPIKVKDGETIAYQVTETRHGPVISEFAEDTGKGTVLSLRWTALDATTELEAILAINQAADWEQFETGLEKFLAPAQNFVFAGKDGTIAYKANGNIPIYENGEDALLPLAGWDAETEWKGFIPFDELPRVINPEKGYIATANNKIAGDDYPYHISNLWAQPYRYERIAEVLEAGENLTPEDMMDLQMDVHNLRAREFVPLFTEALHDKELSDIEVQSLELLQGWDYVDNVDSPEALLFHHWIKEIENLLYKDIPDNMMGMFSGKGQTTDSLLRTALNGEKSIWVEEAGSIEGVLRKSLTKTVEKLQEEYGSSIEEWRWGDYHQVQFDHPLSGIHPVLAFFFNSEKPMEVGGSSVTPMAASYEPETGMVDHGASWRFVIDFNDMQTGYHIVGPGQSGHFKSDWYDDQVKDWVKGTYHETKLVNYKGEELILKPE
ncbi:penicillin acylase family protein [Oceanobacillus manasiensis]|uniref:penicillin acylase family protein n=1 Tax=Oceanobacillus manasiensis TaxID=586413 RepID=UPI000B10891F|nr:penicillin acylase family protein [Oceanobacillus manasiensis]